MLLWFVLCYPVVEFPKAAPFCCADRVTILCPPRFVLPGRRVFAPPFILPCYKQNFIYAYFQSCWDHNIPFRSTSTFRSHARSVRLSRFRYFVRSCTWSEWGRMALKLASNESSQCYFGRVSRRLWCSDKSWQVSFHSTSFQDRCDSISIANILLSNLTIASYSTRPKYHFCLHYCGAALIAFYSRTALRTIQEDSSGRPLR